MSIQGLFPHELTRLGSGRPIRIPDDEARAEIQEVVSHGAAVPMVSVEDSETATLRSVCELDEPTELVEPFDIDHA